MFELRATLVAVTAYGPSEQVASTGHAISEWAGLGRSTPTTEPYGRDPRFLNGDLCVIPKGEDPVAHGYTSDAGYGFAGLFGARFWESPACTDPKP